MSDFNPYRDWLDLEVTDKPTYYQLLGVSPSETDDEEIRNQAKQRLRQLSKVDDPSRETLKQRLATAIKRAAQCLLDGKRREKYDAKLSKLELETAPVVETGAPKVQSAVRIDPTAKKKPSVSQRYKQQTKQRGMLWICVVLGLVSIAGIGYLVATQTSFGKSILGYAEPAKPAVVAKKTESDAPDVDVVDSREPTDDPNEPAVAEPEESETPDEVVTPDPMPEPNRPSRPTPSADDLREFGKLLSDARTALENQDTAQAKRLLAKGQDMPSREKDREKYERLVTLTDYVADYWQATQDAIKRLRGGTEIMIGERRIMLVEINREQLVIRAEGRNRTYERDALPMWFRVWLADSWFDKNAASTKVFRGAMMAVSSEYGPKMAKEIWQEARREGADLGDLELVLADDYDLTN